MVWILSISKYSELLLFLLFWILFIFEVLRIIKILIGEIHKEAWVKKE